MGPSGASISHWNSGTTSDAPHCDWKHLAFAVGGAMALAGESGGDVFLLLGWTAPRHRVPELGCQKPRPEPSMSHITRIGIDTSKAVFTLHCVDDTGRALLRTNLRRAQIVPFFIEGHCDAVPDGVTGRAPERIRTSVDI